MQGGESNEPTKEKFGLFTHRAYVVFMLFLGMANAYIMRTNMAVAIVAMVNHTAIKERSTQSDMERRKKDGEFVWSYQMQGYILASFFYGYVLTQIPFGLLIKNYGSVLFLGWGMVINSVASFLVPISAYQSPYLLGVMRFIQGLGEGPIVPCSHSLLANWVPPNERSRCSAAVYAGAQFGTILAMPISGLLAEYYGWEMIFYVFGVVSLLWSIVFLFTIYDDPTKAKRISERERDYIQNEIWSGEAVEKVPTPVCKIVKSMAFWAIMVAHAGQNYGYETLMTELPTFMANVLHVAIKENGFYSALPYLGMWMTAMSLAVVADCMISRYNVSITVTRKVMNSIGQYGPGITLFCVPFFGDSLAKTLALLTIGMSMNGAIFSGFKVNHIDLSPMFAGLLIAVTNCTANLVGLLGPIVAGHIINNDPSVGNWRIVFWIAASVYVFCATFYNIFGSGKRQF